MTLTENSSVVINDTQGPQEHIHIIRKCSRGSFPCVDGTKIPPVFLPAGGEASWLLLPSLVFLVSSGTVQPESSYSCILKSGLKKQNKKKRIRNNIDHSYHQHSSPWVSLKADVIIQIQFYQPNWEKLGWRLINVMKHLPIRS